METPQKPPAVYFQSLTIENVRCFKGEHTIDLSDGNGKPAMWTVILGNNNTGKTTLLRCLADLESVIAKETNTVIDDKTRNEVITIHTLRLPKIFKLSAQEINEKYQRSLEENIPYTVSSELVFQLASSYRTLHQLFQRHTKIPNSEKIWAFGSQTIIKGVAIAKEDSLINMFIYSYGATRRSARQDLPSDQRGIVLDPFLDTIEYINVEDWLLRIHIAKQSGEGNGKIAWDLVEKLFTSAMPDMKGISVEIDSNSLISTIVAYTKAGVMPLRNLGYGYQSTAVWLADFAQKMLQRYNNAEDTFEQPAIVLIDELDSHLHPEWQRTIISTLSKQFPATQFIVTTHSPLLVQSFEKVNLVVLHKNTEDDSVQIEQYRQQSFQGWTVEEILRDVMRMGERIYSDEYVQLRRDFDAALDEDDYAKAKHLRDKLKQMMNERNPTARVLDMQVEALNGVAHD
jgi:predicted ATP-dependent endonuclease of OLD family